MMLLSNSTVHDIQLTNVLSMNVFLRAKAGTAIARLSHCNSVHTSVCLSVTQVDQSKTM